MIEEAHSTTRFSAGYELAPNVRVLTFSGDEALMDSELFSEFQMRFGEYFIGAVGGLRYQFKPSGSVPAGAVAVPAHNHDNPEALLVQR